ncbi:MAG: LCP family protein [Acidimicrobiales bacterium]
MTGSVPNEDGLRSLGESIASSKGRRRRRRTPGGQEKPGGRRHRGLKRTLLIGAIVIVLLVAGSVGYGFYLNSKVNRVAVSGLSPALTQGSSSGTENILMVGSTSRCALAKQTPAYGLCTQGVNGVNSDVIMILHLNPAVPSVSILSIPRTTFIPNARNTGTGYGAYKIDAALYQGKSQLVAAIEEDFGIPIQHLVELNFDTFANVVNALGGITMEFPEPVFDKYSGLDVLVAGCHHLDGTQALQVVRARHLQYKGPGVTSTTPATWPQETQSDLARIRRDHEFLRVLASEVSKRGLANPVTDQALLSSVVSDLTVDNGFSLTTMVNLVLTYHAVNVNNAPQRQLPVLVGTFGTYTYKGFPKGSIVFPTEPQDQQTINATLGIANNVDSMTGGTLPSPGSVTVSVLNGTGQSNQAATTSQALGQLGFKMVGTGTTAPVGQVSETLVTYAHRTPTDEAAAQLVARSLSGSVIMDYGPTSDGAQVTVTTGTNFSVDASAPTSGSTTTTAPAATTTTTAAPTTTSTTPTTGSASTTSSTSSTTTTKFAAPSPSVQPLKPYDPRACPAGVKGNTTGWGT